MIARVVSALIVEMTNPPCPGSCLHLDLRNVLYRQQLKLGEGRIVVFRFVTARHERIQKEKD